MTKKTDGDALVVLSQMLGWRMKDGPGWDTGLASLGLKADSDILWSVKPTIGGPVQILHRCYPLHGLKLGALVEIVNALAESAEEIDHHSGERADFEQDMRKAAKALLRRKTAAGIRLVGVLCQPIETGHYQNVGVRVTFAWGEGEHEQTTFNVWHTDQLASKVETLIAQLKVQQRLAA